MRLSECFGCKDFPCSDANHQLYQIPNIDIDPEAFSIVLISEAAPANPDDYYYATGDPLFQRTSVAAFNDAGIKVSSIQNILDLGIYLTTAVKCGKTGYGIATSTVRNCSLILEQELALFQNIKAFLLMGDVAIKAVNCIAQRAGDGRVIPPGSTYKIRSKPYFWRGRRAFPSYLQAGPSFFIEKSKRRMIAEDIAAAMLIAGNKVP